MKLSMRTSVGCVLVARNKKEYSRNGQNGCVYTLGIVSGGQVAEVSCVAQVYDKAGEIGQYVEVYLYGEFDTNYKNLKITGIEPVAKK